MRLQPRTKMYVWYLETSFQLREIKIKLHLDPHFHGSEVGQCDRRVSGSAPQRTRREGCEALAWGHEFQTREVARNSRLLRERELLRS